MSIPRLSPFELMFLRLETPDWPCHFAGLAVLEGGELTDAAGRLDLDAIRDRLALRVQRVPALRRRLHRPGLLQGRPLWVDDPDLDIRAHVRHAEVPAPGTEAELLATTDRVYGQLLDRSRPLWELWLLTGLADGRTAVLIKLHHAIADGLAAVTILGALLDATPDAADPPADAPPPQPPPSGWALLADDLAAKRHALGRSLAALARPRRLLRDARFLVRVLRRYLGAEPAPRTSLNRPVQAGRRIAYLRADLGAVKQAAHAAGATVNDVVLALWTAGLRRLLLVRGEPVDGLELYDGVAVTLRPSTTEADTVDNRVGTAMVRLPVGEEDPERRLARVSRAVRDSRSQQLPATVVRPLAALAATPLGRRFTATQRANNLLSTNVIGPTEPLYLLGARLTVMLPIIELVGNIGLTLCAFSYTGELTLVVTADATAFPDLDVLVDGMAAELDALAGDGARQPDGLLA